jgi:hypothetical protein
MKWDVSYTRKTNGETIFYSHDDELNSAKTLVEAPTAEEAINIVKSDVTELMMCNCLDVEVIDNKLVVCEPSDHEFIECYYDFSAVRVYTLLDKNGQEYRSLTPGTIGGYKRKKIYGRLDCPSAKRHIAKGEYIKYRVFFADEKTAKAAGYRPCGVCMKEEYKKWKAEQEASKPEKRNCRGIAFRVL